MMKSDLSLIVYMFFYLVVFLNDCLNENDSYDFKQYIKVEVLCVYIWIYL